MKKIFDLFLKSIDVKLEEKREVYKNRSITDRVIKELAFKIFESRYKRISLEAALEIMDEKFPRYPYLLSDLIEESILIKNIYEDYSSGEEKEEVYFSYERFGDFYIANELLNNYESKEEVIIAFEKKNQLGELIEDEYYYYDGILEAMATILPEKYNLEIFEVYNWIYEKFKELNSLDKNERYRNHDFIFYKEYISSINSFFLDSLNWRTVDSIDDDKITSWFKKNTYGIGNEEWFLKLVELTAIKHHPFNSDRLHRILSRYSMAKRDGFWQNHMKRCNGYDDHNNGFPIRRLIDWAWTENISNLIDEETARLCGQTLSWVLSSTNRILRDQTTKSLVNLLENQSDALIKILKSFEDNDDFYIRERLYAIAYGCVLRTEDDASIADIATCVYDLVFKHGNPPAHILLRDYARNIIEYSLYKKLKVEFDVKLIRPPYNTKLPKLPSVEDIAKYYVNRDDKKFDKKYGAVSNQIYFEVINWDFGTKTIEPEFRDFEPISFTIKSDYKTFVKKLKKENREQIEALESIIESKVIFKEKKRSLLENFTEEEYNEYYSAIDELYEKIIENISEEIKDDNLDFILNSLVPYFNSKAEMKKDIYCSGLDSEPFKRWIVKRVFELGYDVSLHGYYDKNFSKYAEPYYDEVERIGEKYQWIALHEILAIVSDNFKIRNESYQKERYSFYQGAWQLYVRDIDPVSTTRVSSDSVLEDVFDDVNSDKREWWSDVDYNFWDKSNYEWSESIEDLPDVKDLLIKKDENNVDWFFLEYFPKWNEPKRLGQKEFMRDRKDLGFSIRAYLIRNSEKVDILNFLKEKNFDGDWMPRNQGYFIKLFNREKFWSPAFNSSEVEPEWSQIMDKDTGIYTRHEVMVTTTNAKGTIEGDKSGANYKYDIPCKNLFEGLDLKYSSRDGDFHNEKDDLVVTNINPNGTLIKGEHMMKYLDENDLSIVWTVIGRKTAKSKNGFYHYKIPCGVFSLEKEKLKGGLKMFSRDN